MRSNIPMMNGGNVPRMNPMQMLQQLQQNPAQMLRQVGLNVPDNLSSPNDIIQHLMSSGKFHRNNITERDRWRRSLGDKITVFSRQARGRFE